MNLPRPAPPRRSSLYEETPPIVPEQEVHLLTHTHTHAAVDGEPSLAFLGTAIAPQTTPPCISAKISVCVCPCQRARVRLCCGPGSLAAMADFAIISIFPIIWGGGGQLGREG